MMKEMGWVLCKWCFDGWRGGDDEEIERGGVKCDLKGGDEMCVLKGGDERVDAKVYEKVYMSIRRQTPYPTPPNPTPILLLPLFLLPNPPSSTAILPPYPSPILPQHPSNRSEYSIKPPTPNLQKLQNSKPKTPPPASHPPIKFQRNRGSEVVFSISIPFFSFLFLSFL